MIVIKTAEKMFLPVPRANLLRLIEGQYQVAPIEVEPLVACVGTAIAPGRVGLRDAIASMLGQLSAGVVAVWVGASQPIDQRRRIYIVQRDLGELDAVDPMPAVVGIPVSKSVARAHRIEIELVDAQFCRQAVRAGIPRRRRPLNHLSSCRCARPSHMTHLPRAVGAPAVHDPNICRSVRDGVLPAHELIITDGQAAAHADKPVVRRCPERPHFVATHEARSGHDDLVAALIGLANLQR